MRHSERTAAGVQLAATLAAWMFGASAASAADGRALYATCAPCHGAHGEGVSSTGAPNIAGMDAWYLVRQLNAFASGVRGSQPGDTYGAAMKAATATLTADRDRAAVAAFVASMPRARAAAAAAATDNGRNYFNAICSACHGANGLGNESLGAPRLAGVSAAYLSRTMAAFKSGQRGAHPQDRLGAQMRAIVAMLPDPRTEQDVIAYAASLKP